MSNKRKGTKAPLPKGFKRRGDALGVLAAGVERPFP